MRAGFVISACIPIAFIVCRNGQDFGMPSDFTLAPFNHLPAPSHSIPAYIFRSAFSKSRYRPEKARAYLEEYKTIIIYITSTSPKTSHFHYHKQKRVMSWLRASGCEAMEPAYWSPRRAFYFPTPFSPLALRRQSPAQPPPQKPIHSLTFQCLHV